MTSIPKQRTIHEAVLVRGLRGILDEWGYVIVLEKLAELAKSDQREASVEGEFETAQEYERLEHGLKRLADASGV